MHKRESPSGAYERKTIKAQYSTRRTGTAATLTGYAAVYDSMSEDLGGFKEILTPGAFRSVLSKNPDVRLLVNHDTGRVLARTKAGTLTLKEDTKGLRFTADLPNTKEAEDIQQSIKRGDINQMSFGFNVGPSDYDVYFEGDQLIRRVNNIQRMLEISIVTFPAYQDTLVSVGAARAVLRRGRELSLVGGRQKRTTKELPPEVKSNILKVKVRLALMEAC